MKTTLFATVIALGLLLWTWFTPDISVELRAAAGILFAVCTAVLLIPFARRSRRGTSDFHIVQHDEVR